MNLLAQRSTVSARSGRFLPGLDNLQFRPPLVQASSRDAEFLGQFTYIVASAHPFDSHPLKLTRISLPLHFAALSLQSVPIARLSFQGCTPLNPFLECPVCNNLRRALYGWASACGPTRTAYRSEWRCRECAGLRYASEGGALLIRSRGLLGRLLGVGHAPRPKPWLPIVFSIPSEL